MNWTAEMQEALNAFNRMNEVERAYGRPLPWPGKTYPPPEMERGGFRHQHHFAIWTALASLEERAEHEAALHADMTAWKQRVIPPALKIDSSKIIINI